MFSSPSRFENSRLLAGFTSLALICATGCSSTRSGGSSQADADRGGRSPAGSASVGQRDGGTDRVRTARGQVAGDARGGSRGGPTAGANGMLVHSLAYPTGDRATSVLMLEAEAPQQVRVGQPYTYNLRVTNLTDTPLHGVEVRDMSREVPADTRGQEPESGRDARRPAGAGDRSWTVGTLAPRQTQQKQVNATADEVGTVGNCLSVSYNPTLCVGVQVVKPELQITKAGPTSVLACEDIPYTYRVTNSGTGIAQNVRVEEELPEGLATPDGGRTINLPVGDLNQGQSKEVTARLRARSTGEFTSRATAKSAGAEARSREIKTAVRQPVLAVAVEGPEYRYTNEPVDYRVTVRNTGDVAADRAVVRLSAPGGTERLADRDLGAIPPGESRSFTVTTRSGRQAGDLRLTASAQARCAAEATNAASVAIRTIPALRLECVDTTDPVRVDATTSYTIRVTNTGSGPDTNINVAATIPPELQYAGEGQGNTTQIQADGQKLRFGTVPTLAAGQSAQWVVQVKAVRPGDARFGIEMSSASLTKPVDESESTRVVEQR